MSNQCMMIECSDPGGADVVFCADCLAHVPADLRATLAAGHPGWVAKDLRSIKPFLHAVSRAREAICQAQLADAHVRQDFEAALLYGTLLDRIGYHVKHTAESVP